MEGISNGAATLTMVEANLVRRAPKMVTEGLLKRDERMAATGAANAVDTCVRAAMVDVTVSSVP